MVLFLLAFKFITALLLLTNSTSAKDSKPKPSKKMPRDKSKEDWSGKEPKFKGSRLGTTRYNKEMEVIRMAKDDYFIAHQNGSYLQRKTLLCVVFMRPSASTLVLRNVQHMRKSCEWAFIFYDGKGSEISKFCKDSKVQKAIHCKLATQAFTNKKLPDISRRAIPKSVLYRELLPYMSGYQRIFLMDEDISLLDFNVDKFLQIWDCSMANQSPPLIVQPVIAEPTQYFDFVLQETWKDSGIIAASSGLIEQQVPFFDSIFFEWFVKRVLVATKDVAIKYGVDWGHDRSWCNAAKMYSRRVLGWGNKTYPCVVLVGAPPVHHMNTHAMENKRKDKNAFRDNGFTVVQHYINLYPTWVLLDITRSTNPTDRVHGKKYVRVGRLNKTCVRIRGNDNRFILRQEIAG